MKMEKQYTKETIKIDGMTCISCERRIGKKLKQTKGVISAKVSYTQNHAECLYDEELISLEEIEQVIEKQGYTVIRKENADSTIDRIAKMLGVMVIIFALYRVLKYFGFTNFFYAFPEAKENMSYGMIFIIGLLTSVHCIAMCGGINLSQCIQPVTKTGDKEHRWAALRPSFLYNLGRVISYTVIGGIVGALGSVVSFSEGAKGSVQIVAGIFMVIMGLNMLNVFPELRKFNISMPKAFSIKLYSKLGNKSPLYVGLINGLMPCGPLQAMQLYSLSTGSILKGAFAMFLFSLGTVPLMFVVGALSSLLSKKFTHKLISIGAILVVILGGGMLSSGLSLTGIMIPGSVGANNNSVVRIENGVQIVESKLASGEYPAIEVQVGMPVRWVITAEKGSINGCNNRIFIPEYEKEVKFKLGENIIEFTPTEEGEFVYSCWMGMIRSSIRVVKK